VVGPRGDDLTGDERAVAALTAEVRRAGTLWPLVAAMAASDRARAYAREALRVLGDYDVEQLVDATARTLADIAFARAGARGDSGRPAPPTP